MSEKLLVICSVTENSLNDGDKKVLERGIKKLYEQHIGTHVKSVILWMEIPTGQAYLAGQTSNASTILATMPNQLPSPERSAFLYAVRDLWMSHTHCQANELVISASDQSLVQQFLNESRLRVTKFRRLEVMVKLIARVLWAKLVRGRLQTNINL